MNAIAFQNTTFDVVDRNNQLWLRSPQIAEALGYSQANRIADVYTRHADEFTDAMTAVIKLPTAGGEQDTRIFSPRGCYALGMFARTKVAKDFRVWVLDVLEGKAAVRQTSTLTKSQIGQLFDVVAKRSGADGQLRHYMWGRLKEHFGPYASYHDIPAGRFEEALQFLLGMSLHGHLQPEAKPYLGRGETLHETVERLAEQLLLPNSYSAGSFDPPKIPPMPPQAPQTQLDDGVG